MAPAVWRWMEMTERAWRLWRYRCHGSKKRRLWIGRLASMGLSLRLIPCCCNQYHCCLSLLRVDLFFSTMTGIEMDPEWPQAAARRAGRNLRTAPAADGEAGGHCACRGLPQSMPVGSEGGQCRRHRDSDWRRLSRHRMQRPPHSPTPNKSKLSSIVSRVSSC